MKNFIIGQHGFFDYKKFRKDFRGGFYGIEACLLDSEEDIENLAAEACRNNLKIGIHYPLRGKVHKHRDPQFLASAADVRHGFFNSIKTELDYISDKGLKPEYILFHYPKPVILNKQHDWSRWRFTDGSEFVYESEYSYNEFAQRSRQLFEWLAEQGEKYGFIPVLELDAVCTYIKETTLLEELLESFSEIKLCLDMARLHFQTLTDPSFNTDDILKRFSKYTVLIHLSNTRITDNTVYAHFPALPGLKPEDGWADMNNYLPIIGKINRNVKVLFEHRSDLISDEELDKCYKWAGQLLYGV